jgi:hypothetical protein
LVNFKGAPAPSTQEYKFRSPSRKDTVTAAGAGVGATVGASTVASAVAASGKECGAMAVKVAATDVARVSSEGACPGMEIVHANVANAMANNPDNM